MQLRMLGVLLLLSPIMLAAGVPLAQAQAPEVKLNALNERAITLYQAGKFNDAIPLAKRYTAAMKARHGKNSTEYATAINNLALFLHDANRLVEAEPLMRSALAIWEKAYGPNHPQVATGLNNLALLLQTTNRLAEAESLYRRALAIDENVYGPNHLDVARDLNNLAQLLKTTNRLAETETLLKRVVEIFEKSERDTGHKHPNYAAALNNLAHLLQTTNRLAKAEPLMRRALAIDEKNYGPQNPKVARDLNTLALLLQATNRLAEAEPLMRRALNITEKTLGANHPKVATRLNNLALLLKYTNRLAEAEPLMRRALTIWEKAYGPYHPQVATGLNNLAQFLMATNRLTEAEPLMRRVIMIFEKAYGPDHPNVATAVSNLAQLLRATNRLAEAEPLMRRVIMIFEKANGPGHPNVATAVSNLAQLLRATNRLAEAEPLMRRALAIDEKSYGPEHPKVAIRINNLAQFLLAANRLAEAEPLMRRVLAIFKKVYGLNHPNVGIALNNLAALHEEQNDWLTAAALCLQAKPIMISADVSGQMESGMLSKTFLAQNTGDLRNCARAHYHADWSANLAKGFTLAQWALQNAAADALNAMSLRFSRGDARLAQIVRAEQDLRTARTAAYRQIDVAMGKADAKNAEIARANIAKIEARLAAERTTLRRNFPDYVALASPQPLTIKEAQAFLGEDQVLVLFLDLWKYGKVPGETLVFALTKTRARWFSVPLDRKALRDHVTALRCGLDSSNWRQGEESRDTCKNLLNTEVAEDAQPPFDAGMAHALYRDLFGSIENLTRGKTLLIVPSGPLTQLPFEVLVTAEPDKALSRFEAYKKAAWLGQRQAITVLPSVGSLKALHTAKSSEAAAPFIGFGNPLLTGASGKDKSAWTKQTCRNATKPNQKRNASHVSGFMSLFRGGVVNVEALRTQPPLPETADELCAVAGGLGVPATELDKNIYLGKRATVSRVKALSADGKLARARVVHFATHGLLADETRLFAKNRAEPALLLTPPAKASEEDNGLLKASEVAQLKLDADWVILSACNTAAGEGKSAEALSGLARAFFYAGGRSLLVSHWPVNSKAAVELTTGAITAMQREPQIGRAEALRRSISALMAKGKGWDHPSIWAPFVLVGNGGQ